MICSCFHSLGIYFCAEMLASLTVPKRSDHLVACQPFEVVMRKTETIHVEFPVVLSEGAGGVTLRCRSTEKRGTTHGVAIEPKSLSGIRVMTSRALTWGSTAIWSME